MGSGGGGFGLGTAKEVNMDRGKYCHSRRGWGQGKGSDFLRRKASTFNREMGNVTGELWQHSRPELTVLETKKYGYQ